MEDEKKLKQKAKLWGGVAVFIIIVVLGLVKAVDKTKPTNTDIVDLGVSEIDWIKGDINAPVVVVEYADFQCPACGAYHSLVKEVKNKYGENLAVVFRHFPLSQIHKNAFLSSQAAEAAGMQGKFWEMHDMIFENQNTWSESNSARDLFISYAKELDLDEVKFVADLDSPEIKEKISESYSSGDKIGVNSTPSFFINGKKITNPRSLEEFESLIQKELEI